jgi:Ulp1 family protease
MQDNTVDCGVFVCRYAYNLYTMRNRTFPRSQLKKRFKDLITNAPAFKFDMEDIARIRDEFTSLVNALSELYKEFKPKDNEKEEDDSEIQIQEEGKWYRFAAKGG